jgi:hypothetical protein
MGPVLGIIVYNIYLQLPQSTSIGVFFRALFLLLSIIELKLFPGLIWCNNSF